jgi:hypothetical protein
MYTVEGLSIGKITRQINAEGIPTRKASARWERSTVWAVLRNSRSGLQLPFPAWPICCLRLSTLECLTSLADCVTRRVGGGALARWPPSAAQTARTVFPYAAFTMRRWYERQARVLTE